MRIHSRLWLTPFVLFSCYTPVYALVDLGGQVSVSSQAPRYDAAKGIFIVEGVIKNISSTTLPAPISLAVTRIEPDETSLSLQESNGALPTGAAYKVLLKSGELAVNQELPFTLNVGYANLVSSLSADVLEKLATKAFKFPAPTNAYFNLKYFVTKIPANNRLPTANAGFDQEVNVGATVNLDASASSDADEGQTLGYQWLLKQKPQGSLARLTGADQVNSQFTADVPGIYAVELSVNDGFVLSQKPASVKITAYADSNTNHFPKIVSPATTNGTNTRLYTYPVQAGDANGDPLTYRLTKAPSGMTISAKGVIEWLVSGNDHEHVPVSVEVSDGRGGIATQDFSIHIQPCTCS